MSPKNLSKKTKSLEPSKPSLNPKAGKSPFTRDLTPSEIESLRQDKKEASAHARAYFEKKFPPEKR